MAGLLQVEKELEAYGDIVFVREKTNYKSILYKTFYVSGGQRSSTLCPQLARARGAPHCTHGSQATESCLLATRTKLPARH